MITQPTDASHQPVAWHWSGDRFLPCHSVPLSDRGFRYGMSLFESVMIRAGQPVFLREHLERIVRAGAQCGFQFDARALDQVENLLRGSVESGLARIYMTAGDGDVSSPPEHCRIFVFAEPRTPLAPDIYERGYAVAVSPEAYQPVFGGLKTANYWANLAALQRARPANEALLFNAAGALVSACMANAFVVCRGVIRTPALRCGARPGVVREWVMQRREVEECILSAEDVKGAGEIFLTSSWLGVMPVRMLEGRRMPVHSTAGGLHEEFERAAAAGM